MVYNGSHVNFSEEYNMRSMTGYGKGEIDYFNRKFSVEIRCVNHRYLDMNIRIPKFLLRFEEDMKKIISSYINRGKMDVYVSYSSYVQSDVSITVNTAISDAYCNALKEISERYDLSDKITASNIANFNNVIDISTEDFDKEAITQVKEGLLKAAELACESIVQMRQKEGDVLKTSIKEKLDIIKNNYKKIEEIAPTVAKEYRARLESKLNEIPIDFDENRLLTEVMIFSDKACIDEEITRMNSHLEQMYRMLDATEPIGKKMDFLIQEMVREANTTGSKSNNTLITTLVVDTKNEIEKIREQVQNIE
ncbi:MAG TPA: YicC family protein [Lachnospiraceae bacterium]|nr:YicC family protein [Lachnospiraceae bacterium]